MESPNLFKATRRDQRQLLGPNAVVLCGFALPYVGEVIPAIADIETVSPFRHMVTPGGFTMSVALTNCGELGWTTDRRGYRYTVVDPESGRRWPEMCIRDRFYGLGPELSESRLAGIPEATYRSPDIDRANTAGA